MFAWTGAALFVSSLLFFVFRYVVAFAQPAALTPASAPLVDVLLFSIFALHHSLFVRDRVRAWMSRVVPAEHERTVYVWIASLLFFATCALWRPVAGVVWEVTGAARGVLWVLQAFGVWLTVQSAATIGVLVLAGVRPAPGTGFKANGPYGWVRHPIYTAWFLLVFATSPMTMTRLVFAVTSGAYLLLAIPFEERALLRASAGDYERYRNEVRWKLIPGLY